MAPQRRSVQEALGFPCVTEPIKEHLLSPASSITLLSPPGESRLHSRPCHFPCVSAPTSSASGLRLQTILQTFLSRCLQQPDLVGSGFQGLGSQWGEAVEKGEVPGSQKGLMEHSSTHRPPLLRPLFKQTPSCLQPQLRPACPPTLTSLSQQLALLLPVPTGNTSSSLEREVQKVRIWTLPSALRALLNLVGFLQSSPPPPALGAPPAYPQCPSPTAGPTFRSASWQPSEASSVLIDGSVQHLHGPASLLAPQPPS